MDIEHTPTVNEVIEALGGVYATARLFSIRPPSVINWRYRNKIPPAREQFLRLYRPDLYRTRKRAAA